MYDYLQGEVASFAGAHLVLDVGGVGYDLAVPLGSLFPARGKARAYTHLVVREDAHLLFGFADRETRELFRSLLSVRGVGPGTALGLLSGLSRIELLEAIAAGDAAALKRVRGIGKKTAEQILLDMRDKAARLMALAPGSRAGAETARAAQDAELFDDAAAALMSIGYSEKEAKLSVERAAKGSDKKSLEELVRAAIAG